MIYQRKYLMIDNVKIVILLAFLLCFCTKVLSYPKLSSGSIISSIHFCINILVPSLFPFIFVSSFSIKSRLASKLELIFMPLTKLFKLPMICGTSVFLSYIGGYPCAAEGIKILLESNKISIKQAERMLCFCICAGPAFIINVLGVSLLNNPKVGYILLLSHILSSVLIGIGCALFSNDDLKVNSSTDFNEELQISEALIESTTGTSYSVINMCSFVVLFSCILSIIKELNLLSIVYSFFEIFNVSRDNVYAIISLALEISSGCLNAASLRISPIILSFFLGFGGVCVQLQILSIFKGVNISKLKFISFRFVHGILSSILTYFLFLLIPITVTSGNIGYSHYFSEFAMSAGNIGSILLILLSVMFICDTKS